ncbi:hypothetical protein RRG08_051349 [Elysia crispata]|uniref:Uncharacterized protein n=1 Tax=Elysia crispata TaxID=231223 RepID=A0AAE1E9B1_9GAST|nr:hypothetical protein RRG08_051349 [Elysia crispata]
MSLLDNLFKFKVLNKPFLFSQVTTRLESVLAPQTDLPDCNQSFSLCPLDRCRILIRLIPPFVVISDTPGPPEKGSYTVPPILISFPLAAVCFLSHFGSFDRSRVLAFEEEYDLSISEIPGRKTQTPK